MSVSTDKHYVIDFDSTFTRVEALDILGEISLGNHPMRKQFLKEISDITDLGMAGELSFRESLEKRIRILKAHRDHLPFLVERLQSKVSKSFIRNRDFLEQHADQIYIISNGFKDFIDPIVAEYGIKSENVFANTFVYDEEGFIQGFDRENLLSGDNGKVELVRSMGLEGDIYVIGDGHNDYMIRKAGVAHKFYAFTENVQRKSVLDKADHIAPSLDEILYVHKLNKAISYPKNRIRTLILEEGHPEVIRILREEGYSVEIAEGSMPEAELLKRIEKVSILWVGPNTHITRSLLEKSKRLMAIGVLATDTDHIDLEACLERGIAVFNAPFSEARSVVELVLAEIILLMRKLPVKFEQMKQGQWNRVTCDSREVRGKTLGIVGYGNIGSQLSILAEALGMKVFYVDKVDKLSIGNAEGLTSIEELVSISDVVSIHIGEHPENYGLFDRDLIGKMKPGSILINVGFGPAVDANALKEALDSGHISGAALDVFPVEPREEIEKFQVELASRHNVLLSPHIAGITDEAMINMARFVPSRVLDYVNTGSTTKSLNFPNLRLPSFEGSHRLIHIHKNVPGIMARINNCLAQHDVNVVGQYLKTNESIGYVITDIDKEYSPDIIEALKKIEDTIKFRVLY